VISIRNAADTDGPSLAAIDQETWTAKVSPAPPREAGAEFFSERTRSEDVLVAEVEGQVAGYLALYQAIPLPSHEHVLEVNGLAVSPRWQGRGVGGRLVEEAKREASRRGARKLTLRVLAPNASARRLYEECGFEAEGVLRGEFVLDGQLTDDVLMACHLPETGVR